MRKAYLYLIILLISCVLLYGIFIVVNDIMELQAKLDGLYWISENTHSGMVGIFIEKAELALQQKTTTLVILAASLVIFVVAGVYRTSKCISILGMLLLFLLLLVPVPARARSDTTVNTSADRYYARGEMYVPASPPIGDLVDVSTWFNPFCQSPIKRVHAIHEVFSCFRHGRRPMIYL